MGCSSSKQIGDIDFEVLRGQQAHQNVKLRLQSGGVKNMAKGLKRGKKAITWVKNGSTEEYQIYSKLIDIDKNGYRTQQLTSADESVKFCYFQRAFNPYLKSHHYQCRAFDNSRTLFNVYRDGKNDLIVDVVDSYDPDNSQWRTEYLPPRLKLDFHGGDLLYQDPESGEVLTCAHITPQEVKVYSGMDQVVCAVLAAIVAEIKELNGLLSMAQYAAPKPAKGAAGVALRGATYMMQTDPNARGKARNREDIAFQAAGDFASNKAKGMSYSDSAYASANTSLASSREVSRTRQGQGQYRGRDDERSRSHSRGRSEGGRSQSRRYREE